MTVDGFLEFKVEDNAVDLAAVSNNVLGFLLVEAVESGIVLRLAKFDEAVVELLAWVHIRGPVVVH